MINSHCFTLKPCADHNLVFHCCNTFDQIKYIVVWGHQGIQFSLPLSSLVPDDHETMSELAYPSSRSRFGQPARSSSRAMMPLRRLDTLKEAPSVSVLDESIADERGRAAPGMSRTKSSSSDSRVPAPRRHFSGDSNSGRADNLRNDHQEAEAADEEQQPSSPSPAWAAEPRDSAAAQNPLLRRPQWNPRKR